MTTFKFKIGEFVKNEQEDKVRLIVGSEDLPEHAQPVYLTFGLENGVIPKKFFECELLRLDVNEDVVKMITSGKMRLEEVERYKALPC